MNNRSKRRVTAGIAGMVCLAALSAITLGQAPSIVPAKNPVVDNFHTWFYGVGDQTWNNMKWMGVPIWKNPMDMWIYQELLFEVKPDVVIECGTWKGASALFFAHMFDLMKKGRVITIDIQKQPNQPVHPRITYLLGSSTSKEIFQKVSALVKPGEKVLVALDSDHVKPHVLQELRLYHKMVTVGSYLIVEDTNANGHPVLPKFGPGPMEALEEFLKENNQFTIDRSREKFGFTFNPSGFLKRVK